MKKSNDPRHLKRIQKMQDLFTWNFQKEERPKKDIEDIILNLKEIDELIQASATNRPIKEINKVDLSILRLSVFELIIKKDTPLKVVIDEAIELGKEYGSDSSSSFINGVLGKVVNLRKINI